MPNEIERKFLLAEGAEVSNFRAMAVGSHAIAQGYLWSPGSCTVRVRVRDDEGFLTVKGQSSADGLVRQEWEYPIAGDDARFLLSLCPVVLSKRRWLVPYAGHTWEVDEFDGRLQGLIIAEIELPSVDTAFEVPPFIGREVTGDVKYYNSSLAASLQ